MEINNLNHFIKAIMELLKIIDRASPALFRLEFRKNLHNSLDEVQSRLEELSGHKYVLYPDEVEEMQKAGLSGNQLKLKLESFESSLNEFVDEGGVDNLELTLDKGKVILSSLAGAIPWFGSFAQELVDFILKELKKRFKFRKK